jgi:2-dehydropantoate 2-reductase
MDITIIGAGAIGGLVGARLALAGERVTMMARGANLAAIRAGGLTLIEQDGSERRVTNVMASDDYAGTGPQDLVILAVKAQQVAAVADNLGALLGPDTAVVTMQNGIPFWYFQQHGGALAGSIIDSVDPDGVIAAKIPVARVIGSVVYPAAVLEGPGRIRHIEGDRFPLGEPDGSDSERVRAVSACFQNAGLKAPVLDNIRAEIWLKLWGNLTFNPISALSHATLVDICEYPLTRHLAASMMLEAQQVANRLGITFRVPLEKRIDGAARVGKHKTSMLQDVEAGRGSEIDALVGAVIELARLTDTPTPHIDTAYALVKLLNRGLEGENAFLRMQKRE